MAIDDLIFLHWNHDCDCHAVVDKHFEGYHTLQLMSDGQIVVAYDDDHITCEGAWAWPAFPGPRIRFHSLVRQHSWHHRYLAFNGPRIQSWLAAGIWPERPQSLDPSSDIFDRMDDIQNRLEREQHWEQVRSINLLEGILIDLAAARQMNQQEPWLATALQHLDCCPDLRPDCNAIARACALGPIAFQRRFKKQMGLSPNAYCRHRRISRAKELLAGSDAPLADIAEQLNYADQYYFSRHFKQEVGMAPGHYRRSLE